MLVKACLNGGRTRAEHVGVPVSPEELAREARAAVDAGAGALHIHPRDGAGAETLDAGAVAAALQAVRQACPGTPVGVSTGLWMVGGDPAQRLSLIRAWKGGAAPDFASVNLSEPGASELAALLRSLSIGVEAGVWTVSDARELATSPFAADLTRVLIEPQGAEPTAVATAAAVEAALDAEGVSAARLHHGYGAATWAVIEAALALGRDVRVGLEDTTVLPDGRRARGNGELVAAAVALAGAQAHS